MDTDILKIIFWLCCALILYTYVGYAGILALLGKIQQWQPARQAGYRQPVSILVAAYNEECRIGARVDELVALIKGSALEGEVIVVSDGSTDATALVANAGGHGNVQVLEMPQRSGKAAALSAGTAAAENDILVLADARQRWDSSALLMLLENFADPKVGAVSGDLVVESGTGVMAGVGLYWRYEKWLRKKESCVHSTVGVTGAISAVRRSLFPCIPQGLVLDDVYWPLCVALQGYRVLHEKRAIAYDRLPHRARDEFLRKVRTLAGNFQLVVHKPTLLLPWCNPLWCQFVSHKLLRLVVPWALLAMVFVSAFLADPFYQGCFWAQMGFYALAVLGNVPAVGRRLRLAGAAASLLVLNAAAWMAFWVWVSGRSGRSWKKVAYKVRPPSFDYSVQR